MKLLVYKDILNYTDILETPLHNITFTSEKYLASYNIQEFLKVKSTEKSYQLPHVCSYVFNTVVFYVLIEPEQTSMLHDVIFKQIYISPLRISMC